MPLFKSGHLFSEFEKRDIYFNEGSDMQYARRKQSKPLKQSDNAQRLLCGKREDGINTVNKFK